MITYSRFKNIIIVLLSYAYFLVRGKANGLPINPPRRVVAMYLTKNIGDMIFATPVFRALKNEYPDCHLTVVGSPKNGVILEGNPDIDDYLICPKSIFSLVSLIRKGRFDYGITFASSVLDVGVMFLSRVKSIATFNVQNAEVNTWGFSAMLPLFISIPYFIGQYVAQEYLRLLEPLGINSTDTKKRLYFLDTGKRSVEEFFEREKFDHHNESLVIFSPGAGTKIKQWPAERFAEVADYMTEKYKMRIAVIGGPGDREETNLFVKSLKKAKPLIYVDSSLDELKAFVSYGVLLLANDSGPVYIAEAFGVPTVVVVGPTDENEHPPKGEMNRVVASPNRGKAEMMGHLEGFDKVNARRQIEEVSVEMVIKEVDSLTNVIK